MTTKRKPGRPPKKAKKPVPAYVVGTIPSSTVDRKDSLETMLNNPPKGYKFHLIHENLVIYKKSGQ